MATLGPPADKAPVSASASTPRAPPEATAIPPIATARPSSAAKEIDSGEASREPTTAMLSALSRFRSPAPKAPGVPMAQRSSESRRVVRIKHGHEPQPSVGQTVQLDRGGAGPSEQTPDEACSSVNASADLRSLAAMLKSAPAGSPARAMRCSMSDQPTGPSTATDAPACRPRLEQSKTGTRRSSLDVMRLLYSKPRPRPSDRPDRHPPFAATNRRT